MVPASLRIRADVALGLVALIWGVTFVVVKSALADSSSIAFVFLRMLLATVLLLLFAGRGKGMRSPGIARAGVTVGFFLFAGFALQTAGLIYTTPAKSAFITSMYVVFVPLMQVGFLRKPLSKGVVAGVVAAFFGLYFLTMSAGHLSFGKGDLLTLGCALAFAGHIISVGHFAPRYSAGALAVWQVGACMVFSLVAVPLAHYSGLEPLRFVMSQRVVIALLITGALGTALAFFIQTWAQRFTTSAHAAILFSFEPVFAALTSYVVMGEVLGARGLLGAGLILAGILLAEMWRGAGAEQPGQVSPANHSE